MTAVTENGETTTYAYDELSRPVSVTYADGSTEYSEYDSLGNIIKQIDADGNTTTYGYTVENMVSRVTYADGDTLHYGYDKAGNLVRETDADGGVTRYTYDLLGQLTNVLSADGTTTEYKYNADGEVVSEFVRNIAFNGETEGHYSNLVHTSSKPLVATAIRYPEDAFDSTKGRSATKAPSQKPTKPTPKTPKPPAPNNQSQNYNKARQQATTPTQEEYQQLLRLGYTGSYSQYAYDKQHSNFPSPAEYMYNKQQGRPNYQNFGPVEVANYQSGETSYRVSHTAASGTPKVESVVSSEYNCGGHSTALDYITQAEIAKFQQQQYEGEAIIGALSGAINSFGRNIIDALAGLSRLVRPSKTYNVDTRSKNWKESLENYTKDLSHNGIYNAYGIADTSYAVGQLLGDVASTVAEYVGLVKAAKGITSVISKAPDVISKMLSLGGTLLPASGPQIESAAAVAGTITEAGGLSKVLAIIGDALLNTNAFKNDWNTLQEEINSAENNSNTDSVHVNYNGEDVPVYRGGNDFTVKSSEVRIDDKTGKVKTTHGVSLNVDKDAVSGFGGIYKIESLPDGLKIIQRGTNPKHFEIVPVHEMTLEIYQELLYQIVVSGPY